VGVAVVVMAEDNVGKICDPAVGVELDAARV